MSLLLTLLAALALAHPFEAPAERHLWVDPGRGSDRASGADRAHLLRTLTAAWRQATGRPTRIRILPGRLTAAATPNYFENRSDVTIEAAGKSGSAILPALNMYRLRNVTVRGVTIRGDVHCERCSSWTLDRVAIRAAGAQEALKVNQSDHVTVTSSDIGGAAENAVDFVAVHHALIAGNRIHAEDWCAYVKGGSAYVRVVDNDIYDCGTGGFTAGQGTGLQFMVVPWLRYEAYDVRVYGNRIHDTEGAGLGVNGGYDILFARNVLERVGARSHAIEIVFGLRSCDGRQGDEGRERCGELLERGAWGTTRVDDGTNAVRIPNRHVYVVGNMVVKSPGAANYEIAAPFDGEAQTGSNAPRPAFADDDLQLAGNSFSARPEQLAHELPDFPAWDEPVPAPVTLSNQGLPGMPPRGIAP